MAARGSAGSLRELRSTRVGGGEGREKILEGAIEIEAIEQFAQTLGVGEIKITDQRL